MKVPSPDSEFELTTEEKQAINWAWEEEEKIAGTETCADGRLFHRERTYVLPGDPLVSATPDLVVASWRGPILIFDYKFGDMVFYDKWATQMAVYASLVYLAHGEPISGVKTVVLMPLHRKTITFIFTFDQLRAKLEWIRDVAEMARKDGPRISPACESCPAINNCSSVVGRLESLAEETQTRPLGLSPNGEAHYRTRLTTAIRLGKTLLNEQKADLLEKGVTPTGYTLTTSGHFRLKGAVTATSYESPIEHEPNEAL